MATTATLPIGTDSNHSMTTLRKGDKILLATGDEAVFIEMKRTKFIAEIKGRGTCNVPLWRNYKRGPGGEKIGTNPFITSVIGFDESKEIKSAKTSSLNPGDFFYLEGKKSLYCVEKSTPTNIHAWDVVTKRSYRIGSNDFTFVKWSPLSCKKEFGVA